ncbi:MAG: class I SAM-dependent methyltransferase [Patescibacteria group bacterium]
MLYKIFLLSLNTSFIKRVLRKFGIRKLSPRKEDLENAPLIKKYISGKSFADIGCMWGVNGLNSFIAEENGATKVTAVDVYPESKEFLEKKNNNNSKIQYVKGDINLLSTTQKIGIADVVLCAGVLYHTPDPVHLLTQLRSICGEILILSTSIVPESPGIRNTAVFYPFLDANQRKIWNRGVGTQKAITGPYEPESGYGNWFWGFSPSCVESMLQCSGFEVIEKYIFPFNSTFVCRVVSSKFIAKSGEWTTPQDADFAKFKR